MLLFCNNFDGDRVFLRLCFWWGTPAKLSRRHKVPWDQCETAHSSAIPGYAAVRRHPSPIRYEMLLFCNILSYYVFKCVLCGAVTKRLVLFIRE